MKTGIALAAALVLVVAGGLKAPAADESKGAAAGGPQTTIYDAASAFEFLKTLAGEWERSGGGHDHGGGSRGVNFKVTAAGSSVMETIFPGDPTEMITVYHMNGDDLLLTHYCALQNAPVLKFEKSTKPGEIKFVFSGGTNFDPKVDTHVHEGALRVKDADTFESSFVTFSDGKPDANVAGTLKRKRAK